MSILSDTLKIKKGKNEGDKKVNEPGFRRKDSSVVF
jgi:hypothetical protein